VAETGSLNNIGEIVSRALGATSKLILDTGVPDSVLIERRKTPAFAMQPAGGFLLMRITAQ
jgi:hypothetical protein